MPFKINFLLPSVTTDGGKRHCCLAAIRYAPFFLDLLRHVFIILTSLGLNFNLISQDKKVVLRIDTIFNNGQTLYLSNFGVIVGKQGILGLGESFDSTARLNSGVPNYINTLVLKSDTSTVNIPFDNDNGFLQISNVYKTNLDTLRINTIRIFSNCYKDSLSTRIDYYITKSDGTIGDPYKSKRKNTLEKKSCKYRPPFKLTYVINGQRYLCSIQKLADKYPEITNFHGYKTKEYLKDPDNYKGHVKYFHGVSIRKRYINVVTLTVKTAHNSR